MGLPPRRLGDFEIVREIGRGGMGVVYEARQVSLNRKVALKVLSSGLGLSERAVQRFRREAEAAAKLHHTNIVPVYAIGEEQGDHFYAMELIEGPSLDRVIRERGQAGGDTSGLGLTGPFVPTATTPADAPGPNPSLGTGGAYFDSVARMVADVADALDHAHKQGVIHRDVKPSNLLLSPDGRLSINDFGLARVLEQPGMTMTGEFVGTPAYVSPEQITAGHVPVDHRTDVYSLGATLYELLTLARPFAGERRDQVLAQILQKDPAPPRRVNRHVPVDLETICLKAMDRDPDRRYQTAAEMAEDLRRFVNRFAILARRTGPVERLRKWAKRNPSVAGLVAAVVVAACVAGFFAYQSWQHREAEARARQKLREQKIGQAQKEILQGQFAHAEEAIREALELGAEPAWADWRRGQIAYHRGEIEAAIALLERAAPHLPGNLAVRALLVSAYVWAGRWDDFVRLRDEIEALAPVTTEDVLYKGLALSYGNPTEGRKLLDEAVRENRSLIAHVIRAQVLADEAMHTSKVDFAVDAVGDATAALRLLPGNPSALCMRIWTNLIAAVLWPRESAQRATALASVKADGDALEAYPDLPLAVLMRGWALDAQGRDREAAMVWGTALKHSINAQLYAHALYRQGDVEGTIAFADARLRATVSDRLFRAGFLVEIPARHEELLDEVRKCTSGMSPWRRPQEYGPWLLLLGQKAQVRDAARDDLKQPGQPPPHLRPWFRAIATYLADMSPQAEKSFLQAAGESKRDQGTAHFLIALSRLADGDRPGAREHFRASVAAGCFYLDAYDWSRAYLKRMEDPNWPPRFRGKKE